MKTFKTPKGTELPFLNLKGKDYLLVPHRVLWMREEHPEWSIESQFLQLTDKIAIAQATIRDEKGKLVAQGTKSETPKGFSEYIEKAESGAIGRALAFCGYGTQFAQELESGDQIVDAPINPDSSASAPPGSYQIKMGKTDSKTKGKRLNELPYDVLEQYGKWLSEQPKRDALGQETLDAIAIYLDHLDGLKKK